ncbi:glycoside hydrolase family 127 protein [Sphingomonas sp. LB-2]|uniref:glycoside hydrolase family 127 protein n=1 Tax=Sphingomonas caeni TaxID=2984949 RepID=UPI002230AF46|nr:glycoside hydrolase family 127 protein [Sphingomonas caeni]MCW3846549.1 glycoside hydrolase family 127 protein [Sphingomonas caeni]
MKRRTLLKGMSALAAAPLAGPAFAAAKPRAPIDECAHGDVTLLDGLARTQADRTLAALIAMDEDMLLRPFREAAGMPVGPAHFGGWYDRAAEFDPPRNMTGFIPGHSFGQYVSALARGYAVSGNAEAKAKIDRLLAGFAPTITPDFYKGYPLPAYTYDKHVVGLIDAHTYAGNRQARALLARATDAVLPWLPGRAIDRRVAEKGHYANAAFGWDETYTLPENLYLAAERMGGDRYAKMARAYLLDGTYFALLAAGKNDLPHRHAYSHVNALASAAKAWLADGNPMHRDAARNGLGFVIDQSYATGGWGPNEGFVEPGTGALGELLAKGQASFEAPCGTYGHFKVARYLMRITGDSRWGDSMERLFYNSALGLLPLQSDGRAFYYAEYADGRTKDYYPARCPCCSGTIGQLTADYGINAYLRDETGLYVNLYTNSRAVWRRRGEPVLTLDQRPDYPLTGDIAMAVSAPRPVRMALRLRIPAWAGPATRVAVNGGPPQPVTPGRFATIDRVWKDGDGIALFIDRPLRLEPVDAQHPNRVALVHGPLALFAIGSDIPSFTRAELLSTRQAPNPADLVWTLETGGRRQTFLPWFGIQDEKTRLYQAVV